MRTQLTTLVFGWFLLLFTGCNSGPDCLTRTGKKVILNLPVDEFTSILVNEDIEMVLTQGNEYSLRIETGENLIEDFSAEVVGEQLVLTMKNTCEWVRDYNTTTVYVSAPGLEEIISATQFAVRSAEVLDYDKLDLYSYSFGGERDYLVNGEFFLDLRVDTLNILANEMANFEISGQADRVSVRLEAGDVRVYMPELLVREAEVFHRSAMDITLNPTERVTGGLWSTGDLVLMNRPLVVDVTENYKGRVIYP